ncbi:MAG: vitamin K epoxide reductase family protein [Candidatus Saccharibacteria bacterium]|nr:vitamin K epoxide reductase family protein [Candidatus Saccharibacteria bacterium]
MCKGLWSFVHDKRRMAAVVLLIGAVLGLLASFVLSVEAMILARDANAVLSCSLNAVINCATVASHWSATVFGVPNSFFGMMAMSVVVTIAVALVAGVTFPRWFLCCTQVGLLAGCAAAVWMLYMSMVQIGVLCPWCLVLDVGMVMMLYGSTRYMVLQGLVTHRWVQIIVRRGYDAMIAVGAVVLVALVIMTKFGEQLF